MVNPTGHCERCSDKASSMNNTFVQSVDSDLSILGGIGQVALARWHSDEWLNGGQSHPTE